MGLNPLTRPFDYIPLKGKLTLYAKKDATEQLRKLHGVSITKLEFSTDNGVFTVVAHAQDSKGKIDADMGAAYVGTLKGDDLINARLKAVTKAKRRVTLSIVGLGILDESEIDSIKDATPPNKPTNNYLANQQAIIEEPTYFYRWEKLNAEDYQAQVIDDISKCESVESMEGLIMIWESNDNLPDKEKFEAAHPDKMQMIRGAYRIHKEQLEKLAQGKS